MTYETLIINPFIEMFQMIFSYVPTILTALGILLFGTLFAHLVERLVFLILNTIHFDTLMGKMRIIRVLETAGVRQKPVHLLSSLTYVIFMVIVLIVTVKSLGLTTVVTIIDRLIAYIPHVISGVLVLIFGMLLAQFVSNLVLITAKNTDMPAPELLSRLTKLPIIIYVGIMFLQEIKFMELFVGTNYTIFITGIVFALALAFGLAGRTTAERCLDVFSVKGAGQK